MIPTLTARLSKYRDCVELDTRQTEIKDVVIIGEGTPDDLVAAFLCKNLNGHRTVAMTVSKADKGVAALKMVNNLLYGEIKIQRCILVIDQEGHPIEQLKATLESMLREFGIIFSKELDEGRVLVYECRKGPKTAKLCICINGLDNEFLTHKIEDHLLRLARAINITITIIGNDAKETWKTIGKENQERVLGKIWSLDDVMIIDIFPQHVKAFSYTIT